MNYLAHIFLSREHPESMLGNFIADGLRRSEMDLLPEGILRGVRHHRLLDETTDRHAAFKLAASELRTRHGKYAPVVLDILNDHLLCINWERYDTKEFEHFESEVYREFGQLLDTLPPLARIKTEILIEHKYLKAYRSRIGMEGVMERMDRRARFHSNFQYAISDLYDDLEFFNRCFLQLFDDLLKIQP